MATLKDIVLFSRKILDGPNGFSKGRQRRKTLGNLRVRLKSVKNIQKITQSMKMVSAAKYARAERDLKKARPFGEGAKWKSNFYLRSDHEYKSNKLCPSMFFMFEKL
ncbi:UNVERIFIED_CONTAM: ATPsyngamma [Trichonephila clavipes]